MKGQNSEPGSTSRVDASRSAHVLIGISISGIGLSFHGREAGPSGPHTEHEDEAAAATGTTHCRLVVTSNRNEESKDGLRGYISSN